MSYYLIVIITALGGSISQGQYGPFSSHDACAAAALATQTKLEAVSVQRSNVKVAGDIYQRIAYCVPNG